jgi:hypothetical protein
MSAAVSAAAPPAPALATATDNAAVAAGLCALLRGLDRAHGAYEPRGTDAKGKVSGVASTRPGPLTPALWAGHLAGRRGVGVAPLLDDGTCAWGAIDVDVYDLDLPALVRRVIGYGLPLVVCRTKSGGAHLYLSLAEPAPATLVRRKLAAWAAALGHPGAEVFPKQDFLMWRVLRQAGADAMKVEDSAFRTREAAEARVTALRATDPALLVTLERDTGNWLNAPYYSGEHSTRYALGPDGVALTPAEFVTHARAIAVTAAALESIIPKRAEDGDPLRGAPPCLVTLAATRIAEGGRNAGLFNYAVYLRKRHPDGWQSQVAGYNDRYLDPPLPGDEISHVLKSVVRRDYGYKCNDQPIKAVCDKAACRKCEFGVAGAIGVDALMAELNADYMVVVEAGKTVIYRPDHDPVLNRRSYTRMTFADFRNLYLNRLVAVGTDSEGRPIHKRAAEVWLAHPDRQQYRGGVVFDPSGKHARPDALNLWQGFAIEPKAGSWALMQEHIRTVICRGQPDRYDYLIGWMARMVQRPAEQGEVAVVMRGAEGTGKGTLARALLRLLGQHGLAISNAKHLVGNFNAHLRDCIFLFADEAFYAGDKQHVGVLKSLITEPHLTVEAKYQNTVQSPNNLHLMIASNEEWVVPASLEARRFLMLEVADDRKNDHAYFGAIQAEMEAGGYEAMLHDLQSYDLTEFNVRAFPRTAELGEQQKLSMDTTHRWWMEVLQRGYLHESRYGLADQFAQWMPQVTTGLLYLSYTAYAGRQHERRPISREALGRFMKSVGAVPGRFTDPIIGEELTRTTDDNGHTVTAGRVVTQDRASGYALGALADARAAFTTATGLSVEWEDDGGDTGEEEGERQLELKVCSPTPPTTDPAGQTTDNAGDDPWNVGPPAGLEALWAETDDTRH